MTRTLLALTLTGALAFWSLGCEADQPGEEPGSPPPEEREPGSPDEHQHDHERDEPASPPDDRHQEPGSP